jgi:hypothetical protein
MRLHYVNCLAQTSEPNIIYKGHNWIVVTFVFVFWMQSTKLKNGLVRIQGYQTQKKIY